MNIINVKHDTLKTELTFIMCDRTCAVIKLGQSPITFHDDNGESELMDIIPAWLKYQTYIDSIDNNYWSFESTVKERLGVIQELTDK